MTVIISNVSVVSSGRLFYCTRQITSSLCFLSVSRRNSRPATVTQLTGSCRLTKATSTHPPHHHYYHYRRDSRPRQKSSFILRCVIFARRHQRSACVQFTTERSADPRSLLTLRRIHLVMVALCNRADHYIFAL